MEVAPHKRDFGKTFGIGLVKLSKTMPFWIYFFGQGLYSKEEWVPPLPLDYQKYYEMVMVVDRNYGSVSLWVKGSEMLVAWRDEGIM